MKLPLFWRLWVGGVPEINPQALHARLAESQPLQVIDARSSGEYREGTLGNARHAPVTRMPQSVEQLKLDPGRPVVVLCLSGHRSRPATRWLRAHGFEAYSLQGGLMAWKRAGYALDGAPASTQERRRL